MSGGTLERKQEILQFLLPCFYTTPISNIFFCRANLTCRLKLAMIARFPTPNISGATKPLPLDQRVLEASSPCGSVGSMSTVVYSFTQCVGERVNEVCALGEMLIFLPFTSVSYIQRGSWENCISACVCVTVCVLELFCVC